MIAVFSIDDAKNDPNPWTENQQIMFDYAIDSVLPMLKPDGVWYAPAERSPLTMDQIISVFRRIIEHPNYERQTLDSPDDGGFRVSFDPETRMVTVRAPRRNG